jgi:hypothetical protein
LLSIPDCRVALSVPRLRFDTFGVDSQVEDEVRLRARHAGQGALLALFVGECMRRWLCHFAFEYLRRAGQTRPDAAGKLLCDARLDTAPEDWLRVCNRGIFAILNTKQIRVDVQSCYSVLDKNKSKLIYIYI